MKNNTHLYTNIYKKLSVLSLLFLLFVLIIPIKTSAKTPVSPVVSENSQDDFDKKFRESRDLIDKEEWAKASEKFNELVSKYPANKSTDAALYWLAFCYKKQKMYQKMGATIDQLLKDFPNSSWANDALVLKYNQPAVITTATGTLTTVSNYPSVASANSPLQITGVATTISDGRAIPLEREEEIKLAAFQSLFSADSKRAIEILGDILKPNSKASSNLKLAMIRAIRSPRFFNFQGYSIYSTTADNNAKPNNQLTPQLREVLIQSYKNDSNIKLRTEIIYALATINDEESTNYLVQIYGSEENKELKKVIINSLNGFNYYSFTPTSNSKNSPKVYAALSKIYDSENDESLKSSIINSFATINDETAVNKLLSIAKNDKSDKLRLEAIRSLRTSKNPEVIKFLEDLLK